ncbi:aryl hydrocarbon receptor nuclear translocator-like protein 2 isoform X2 [Anthonomus grandis grandis]|uniref:aryl hydrocarbon receptor nuclear translocator-like protein 2 isoform X2 n=1 Tax=Anthonomus grandis grandis TaxID=2921223 RepID=UPI0021662254|nr:aryl hydrocarbon receptor nuclear translocator-like protein 2 isoform X2 [Anthonomus grandis grandis]
MLSHMVGGHPAGYQGGYSDYTYLTVSGNHHQYQCNVPHHQQTVCENDMLGSYEQPFQPINQSVSSTYNNNPFTVSNVARSSTSTTTGYCGGTPENNMLPNQPSTSNDRHWYNQFQAQPHRPTYNYANPSSREMRNKAEKQRRDRLNSFIAELATLVPLISRSAKRLDKTSILRLTATHLRIYQTLVKNKGNSQMELPPHVDQFVLEQLVCDQMGGFLLIISPVNGKIIFVSHTVETLLGHLQTDLMGQSLFTVTASEDHDRLRMYLGCEGEIEQSWKKYFNIKIRRAGPKSEAPHYEAVRLMGIHKHANLSPGSSSSGAASPTSSAASTSSLQTTLNTDVLVFFVKLCRPQPLVDRLVAASKDEYVTRHLIDGRIVACDQRISLIAGYMTDEVQGHSAFQYIHQEDVRYTMIALRQMYDKGESKGNSCYRLKSRNGQFIYLKTFGFLEIDDQGIVESFVCVNVQVDESEGKHHITEMKRRFRAMFTSSLASLPYEERCIEEGFQEMRRHVDESWGSPVEPIAITAPAIKPDRTEDPQTIEAAVNELMQNLPLPGPETPAGDAINCPTSHGTKEANVDVVPVRKPSVHNPGKGNHPQIVIKQGTKRSQSESPDVTQKRQRLNSVESEPPQLSPPDPRDMPYGNGRPLMPKLEEPFQPPNTHPDVLRHQYHHMA